MTVLEWLKIPHVDDSLLDKEIKTNQYYRVFVNGRQIGAFNIRENAYNLAEKQKKEFDNVYVIEPDGTKVIIRETQVIEEQPAIIIDKGESI